MSRPRVAIIVPSKDPLGPSQWSGTPYGLRTAFEALGWEAVPIGHLLPLGLRQLEAALARTGGTRGVVADRARTRIAARRPIFQRQLRAAAPDLVLALGTEAYRLQHLHVACPVVTYDDATFVQMLRHPDSDLAQLGLASSTVLRWIATQRDSLRAADVACVSTEWARSSLVGDYGLPADRVDVVGMGHRPRTSAARVRRDWSSPTYLFVGLDWRRKNGQRVVDAFTRIRAAHPQATLHLVGDHPPVDAPGVIDHGVLSQRDVLAQTRLDRLYAEATAFVVPSLLDPSPIAYLEAASAGLPVVATTQGGAGELLGEAAHVVDPRDDEGIWAAMEALADPTHARALGAAARRASAESTWAAVAGRIVASAFELRHQPAAEGAL